MKKERKGHIRILKNGPYEVTGNVPLSRAIIETNAQGESEAWKEGARYATKEPYYLCRCGHSSNRPYCDGTHDRVGFDGEECASAAPFIDQAKRYEGRGDIDLLDNQRLCAGARFCDPNGGAWLLTRRSDSAENERRAIQQSSDCPAGRLVVTRKNGAPIEPNVSESIRLIEDPARDTRGPLWARGGIPIEGADGMIYEVRNRVTLCRCGASANMPFCDASHYECECMRGSDA